MVNKLSARRSPGFGSQFRKRPILSCSYNCKNNKSNFASVLLSNWYDYLVHYYK